MTSMKKNPNTRSYELPRVVAEGKQPTTIKCNVRTPTNAVVEAARALERKAAALIQKNTASAKVIADLQARIDAAPLTLADELGTVRTKVSDDGATIVHNEEYFEQLAQPSRMRQELEVQLEKEFTRLAAWEKALHQNLDERLLAILAPCGDGDKVSPDDIDLDEVGQDLKLEIWSFFSEWSSGNIKKSSD
jgi:hypothetical protein